MKQASCPPGRQGAGGVVRPREQGWPERVSVKIGDELARPLGAHARAMEMAPSKWIEALIRRRLLQVPRLARPDELAFIAIQVELRRIGVHIHHVLNQLEAAAGRDDPEHLRQLVAYAAEVRVHLARLRAAFQGNLDYWDDTP